MFKESSKHKCLFAQRAVHILQGQYELKLHNQLILIACNYHKCAYTHKKVKLPDSKAKIGIYKFPLEVSSSKINRCPRQQREKNKEFSWGRHPDCLPSFCLSDSDYKDSETEITHVLEIKTYINITFPY